MRLFIAALIVSTPGALFASTGFHVGDGSSASVDMYAISTGWYYPVDAAAMVNGRNAQRTAELFGASGTPRAWVSKYGSLSITMRGPGFPMSGMNEKGLVIQATILKDQPQLQATDGGLVSTQWLQYQLDMSATVDEVIASAITAKDPVVCLGTGKYNAQFEVCDTSQCARFAFYDGKATVQTTQAHIERSVATGAVHTDLQRTMPVGAVANREVTDERATYERCATQACDSLDFAYQRFILAFKAAHKYQHAKRSGDLRDNVFTDLATLDQGPPLTTWNEIFERDPKTGVVRISFKSPKRPLADVQWISANPAVDCAAATELWWLDMEHAGGDQTAQKQLATADVRAKLAAQHGHPRGGTDDAQTEKLARDYAETHVRCLTTSTAPAR